MDNFIVVAVLILIIGGATLYVLKQRKKGVKCIGCPDGAKCSGDCSCCSSCSGQGGNS